MRNKVTNLVFIYEICKQNGCYDFSHDVVDSWRVIFQKRKCIKKERVAASTPKYILLVGSSLCTNYMLGACETWIKNKAQFWGI